MDRQQFVVEVHDASYNTTLFKHRLLEKILHFMYSTYFQAEARLPLSQPLFVPKIWYMTYIQQCRPNYMRL